MPEIPIQDCHGAEGIGGAQGKFSGKKCAFRPLWQTFEVR